MSALELTILMPCLNEIETVETCIEKALRFLSEHDVKGEVLIADNGSTDGSQAAAQAAGARVVHVEEKGYGSALMGGILDAKGTYVCMADADDSYDFLGLAPFLKGLRDGADLVMGNRFKGGILPGAMPPLHRYLGNPVLTGIGRVLFRAPVSDFHCGLRGFNRERILALDLRTTGMEFASEMVVKCTLHRYDVREVPTTLAPDGRSRPPHLRSFRDGWRHLRFLLLYSPRWLFLYPGLLLILFGSGISVWLLSGPQKIGSVSIDMHTLVFASSAVVIGFQAALFSALTRIFATNEKLLPKKENFDSIFKIFNLETGLIAGVVVVVLSLLGSLYAVKQWADTGFGPLEPQQIMRVVIASSTGLILGAQTILFSFFFSVLGLKRRQ
ncbi:MAG: glycosyltransferase family 2 protein [Deltaproteobacteria bacterium]|nr:glycosyltransferase family 2 protein [Deltaproteobacteria bacterium]